MTGIPWSDLLRFGLCNLHLPPDRFWSLTPYELMMMSGGENGAEHLGRAGLSDLMARFPDKLRDKDG